MIIDIFGLLLTPKRTSHADFYHVVEPPRWSSGARIGAKIPDRMSNNSAGGEKQDDRHDFMLNVPRHDKTCLRKFPTKSDTNQPAQPQKLSIVFKFRL